MEGYVIFASEAAFNTAHDAAKAATGLPKVGLQNGASAPDNQKTTGIVTCYSHPSDGTVVAYINGGWPEDQKGALTFKTLEEVAEYFPYPEL